MSGVVCAGFGRDEHFPRLIELGVDGSCLGKTRYFEGQSFVIDEANDAGVVPFAQQEMVHSFMKGVAPDILAYLQGSTRQVFSSAFNKLLDVLSLLQDGESLGRVEEMRGALGSLQEALFVDWEVQMRNHWGPVVTNVATLPKDELAAMAESFVNLTKFRRRVTVERETVGGPIDVAVITKGDGFVWVKRKHYFDPALNPRLLARFKMKDGDIR